MKYGYHFSVLMHDERIFSGKEESFAYPAKDKTEK